MNSVQTLIKFMPPSTARFIKQNTSSGFRLRVRELLGASYKRIPETVSMVSDGRQFHVGPDRMYWAIYHGLDYEPEATSIVRRLIQKGDTVLDTGANFGWYTTLLSSGVGAEGEVFAFEPVPDTFARLQANLSLNANLPSNVHAIQAALGTYNGTVDIHVFEDKSHGCSSLSDLGRNDFHTIETPIYRLDEFVSEKTDQKISFMKCDVEGAELSVLQGFTEHLQVNDAPVILIELNHETSESFDYDSNDIWNFLTENGYDSFYSIVAADKLRKVRSIEDFYEMGVVDQISRDYVPNIAICAKQRVIEALAADGQIELIE